MGASIAGANPLRVGFTSLVMAPFIYVLPFLFVYDIGLLMDGSPIGIFFSVVKTIIILINVTMLFQRFLYDSLKHYEFFLLLINLLAYIYTSSFIVYAIIFVAIVITHIVRTGKHIGIKRFFIRKES